MFGVSQIDSTIYCFAARPITQVEKGLEDQPYPQKARFEVAYQAALQVVKLNRLAADGFQGKDIREEQENAERSQLKAPYLELASRYLIAKALILRHKTRY